MEKCDMELREYNWNNNSCYENLRILFELTLGLCYLNLFCVHRDLKLDNVMLKKNL